MKRRLRVFAALAVAVAAVAVAVAALGAHDERADVEQSLAALEKDPHTKTLCAEPIGQARAALERAHRMHVAGDDKHARLAEQLAAEWASVAEELARADAAETRAASARSAALDAGARVERERAMLEQELAENGRLGAELAKLEAQDGGAPAPRARDAGAHK